VRSQRRTAQAAAALMACSLPLLLLQLPLVRRWVEQMHNQGRQWVVNLAMLPLAALYIVAFSYIVNEEIFYGVRAQAAAHPALI
jgi:hypothetical protein